MTGFLRYGIYRGMTDPDAKDVRALRKWLTAARPWALPASTMPVAFGASLAVTVAESPLRTGWFILSLLAMVVLHTAANMLSDVFDFRRGLDRDVTPVSGALVRGWLRPGAVAAAAGVLFAVGSGLGLTLAHLAGRTLLYIGGAGVIIGLFYTFLKSRALGDLAVFLNFGILGALGSWVVQTGRFSWLPVVWTVPMALLVSAILHANNWRDIPTDSGRGVRTVASILGDRGSEIYYGFLIFAPFVLVLAMTLAPRLAGVPGRPMPWSFLTVFLVFPQALGLWGRARRRRSPRQPLDFVVLDGATARFNLTFGLMCTLALWLDFLIGKLM